MTDEELIEHIARTVGQKIEGAAEDMDSVWYGAPLWTAYIEEARAILPFIHADREAVRAEQAAELAKWKALAETLATDLRECARALQSLHQIPGTGADGRLWQRIKEITGDAHAAVAQYKEARDAS